MRDQATTKSGEKRFSVVFPKFKKGGYTVREVKVDCTYSKDLFIKIACLVPSQECPKLVWFCCKTGWQSELHWCGLKLLSNFQACIKHHELLWFLKPDDQPLLPSKPCPDIAEKLSKLHKTKTNHYISVDCIVYL